MILVKIGRALPWEDAPTPTSEAIMQIPLQVSFHGIAHSDALYQAIRERAHKLEQYYPHIMSCRVVLELAGRHQRKGKPYTARIDLKVPGGEIAVTHEHDEDVQVALRDAFDAARRRLEDYARTQRGDVKRHDGQRACVSRPHHGRACDDPRARHGRGDWKCQGRTPGFLSTP